MCVLLIKNMIQSNKRDLQFSFEVDVVSSFEKSRWWRFTQRQKNDPRRMYLVYEIHDA
jgi:hypothetical protein